MSERWKPSVTVAAVIVRHDADAPRFLLVEEHTPEGLMLNNPAGHLDPEESPEQGVIREVLEETACAFMPDRLIGIYLARFRRPAVMAPPGFAAPEGGAADLEAARRSAGEDVTFLRIAFGGTAGAPDAARALDTGIVRTLWMTLAELRASRARHRSPHVLACVEDFLAGRRYPLAAITTDATVFAPEIKPGQG